MLAFAFLFLVALVRAAGGSDGPSAPRARTLQFPTDRVVGWLYVRAWNAPENSPWKLLREAFGEVSIPPRKEVRLTIESASLFHLSGLVRLEPDAIQQLEIEAGELGAPELSYIQGLTGLRSLSLA
ncbi:hypothetical protein HYR69_11500, partial [Candidatus Sumerlaeota bacterium]|nr:hypothetical protein [Candidatus Sumerlaeota bacterium]